VEVWYVLREGESLVRSRRRRRAELGLNFEEGSKGQVGIRKVGL
jgi:hypothetical protein